MIRSVKSATIAAVTLLVGCASTNTVLGGDVDEVFHATAPARVVAACFAHRNHLRVIERPDGARVAVFRNGYGAATQTFSIYPDSSGSRIERRHGSMGGLGNKWKRCVGVEPMRPGDTGKEGGA